MKKDKKAVLQRLRSQITPDHKEFVRMNLSIAHQISTTLKKKGLSQKEFAKLLGKQESEVSRLLSGLHNFSLKSLAKIQASLGEDIITTPLEACEKYKSVVYRPLKGYARTNKPTNRNYTQKGVMKVVHLKQAKSLAV